MDGGGGRIAKKTMLVERLNPTCSQKVKPAESKLGANGTAIPALHAKGPVADGLLMDWRFDL